MINITLPDESIKSFDDPVTGFDIAMSISEGLARNCVAMELDGTLVDLHRTIDEDAQVRLITTRDEEALEVLRHSAAHLMAQAILRLYKGAKLTIGPVVGDQFYYDIDMEPVSEDDFPKIEAEIKKIIKEKPNLSMGAYMGLLMAKLKGQASGKEISQTLQKLLINPMNYN